MMIHLTHLGETSGETTRHPGRSEGSPDTREMSAKLNMTYVFGRSLKRSIITMRLLILGLLFLFSVQAFTAPPVVGNPLQENETTFDVKDANKQFDHLNLQLSVQNLNIDNLNAAVKLLKQLVAKSDDCISGNEKRLESIDNQIQQTTTIATEPNKNTPAVADTRKSDADLVYLNKERKKWANQQAQCRLFSIRAKEAIDTFTTAIAKLKQAEALTRGLTLWNIFDKIMADPTKEMSISFTEFPPLPASSSLFNWAILLTISSLVSGFVLFRIHKSKRLHHYIRMKVLRLSHFIILTLCLSFGFVMIYLNLIAMQQPDLSLLYRDLFTILFLYCLGLTSLILLFKIKKVKAFFCWYSLEGPFFQSLIIFLLSLYDLSIVARLLIDHLTLGEVLWQLIQSIFLLTVLTTAIYFIYYFCSAHRHIPFIQCHKTLIRRICTLLFVPCGILDLFGYHTLSIHITFAGIATFSIIFATILIEQGIIKLFYICTHKGAIHHKIITIFGYKTDQTLTELIIMKTTIQVIVFALALYLIGKSWGYATYYLDTIYSQFLYGVHFATFTFYPTRIIAGVLVFCILYLTFRSISTALSRHAQFEDEEETQVAIASILTYLGFAIALISALLIAGFDFTGLAIVAGALSVGIGLGLQSIVNNFVSGIILLIEKPIRPGDRIQIDGVEGIVKKIRVRSTQIISSAREDIIIPNSDLITHRVTNFMYSDKHLSIDCQVGVAYGTNTALVRDLLLKIADQHEEIIKNTRNKPSVQFREFGENAMIFQLNFLIKDGNRKSTIKSDLHFEIEKIFREHHVQFAHPQREVRIKLESDPKEA